MKLAIFFTMERKRLLLDG